MKTITFLNEKRTKLTVFQKDIKMANRYMKRCSTSASTREMQIKTTVRFIPPIRLAGYHQKDKRCWPGCGEKRTLIYCLNVNWSSDYGKQYGVSSKN